MSSTLVDLTTHEARLSWPCAEPWDGGMGGSGARLFLGASEGSVLETYGLEMVLDLVKDGRCLLTSGVAGALAV